MRITGYILIVTAFAVGGFIKNAEINQKIKNSYAYFDFICLIREKIALWQLPLTKIYESITSDELKAIGFTEKLKYQGLPEAYRFIENKLVFESSHLDFCKSLGSMPLVETVKLCDEEIKRLEHELRQKQESLEKKSKLYPALGILAGLAAVILIL